MKRKNILLLIFICILLVVTASFVTHRDSPYLAAAKAGGDYLVTHMEKDGSFIYDYDPVEKTSTEDYNILRHAGTTYALLELYEATHDTKYLTAAEKAIAHLRSTIVPCPVYKDAQCVLEGNEIKLGGNGLALLALTTYMEATGSRDDLARAQGIARFITDIQAKDGHFLFSKMDGRGVPDTSFDSEYYPGEAMLALARFSALSGDTTWIEAAHKGAQWLIASRKDVQTKDLPHDHWFLYTLNELAKDREDAAYVEHTKRLTDAIVAAQLTGRTGDESDWNGGYYEPPRSTPTATRNEGLGAAYELFSRSGDAAYAAVARRSMAAGIDFTLKTQYTKKYIRETGAAPDALGGFHDFLDDTDIRIDYVQHNISALLAFDRITREK